MLKALRTVSTARYWSNLSNVVWQEHPNEDDVDADDIESETELQPYHTPPSTSLAPSQQKITNSMSAQMADNRPTSSQVDEQSPPTKVIKPKRNISSTPRRENSPEQRIEPDSLSVSINEYYKTHNQIPQLTASISEYEAQLNRFLLTRETSQKELIQKNNGPSSGTLTKRPSSKNKFTIRLDENGEITETSSKVSLDKTMKDWRDTTNCRDDIFKEAGKVLGKPVVKTNASRRYSTTTTPKSTHNAGPARRASEAPSLSRSRGSSLPRQNTSSRLSTSLPRQSSQKSVKSNKIVKAKGKPLTYDETF